MKGIALLSEYEHTNALYDIRSDQELHVLGVSQKLD